MRLLIRLILDSEEGATAVEYAVMLGLILMAAIGSLTTLGGTNGGMWSNNMNALTATAFS